MSLDIETLIGEDIDLKNEFLSIFKNLEGGYSDILKVIEKFEKPIMQIIENWKEYARETSETGNQEDSPFFNLAKQMENLIDGQKQYVHDVTDDVVLIMQQIVSKSELLNDVIKELNSAAKNARKLNSKIAKLEEDIEVLHAKGKPEKVPKKEAEKQTKESEFNLAKDKLIDARDKYDKNTRNFLLEKDELLKKSLKDLIVAEEKRIESVKSVIDQIERTAKKMSSEIVTPKKEPAPQPEPEPEPEPEPKPEPEPSNEDDTSIDG